MPRRLAATLLALAAALAPCTAQTAPAVEPTSAPALEAAAGAAAAAAPAPEGEGPLLSSFVGVRGGRFELDGRQWFMTGANTYFLAQRAADVTGVRRDAEQSIADAAALGLNVIRTAAYADGEDQWNAIQPAPGLLNETVLREGLDFVVQLACRRGIRLLLTLTNTWPTGGNLGSMWLYTMWGGGHNQSDFFTQPGPRRLLKGYIAALLGRTNAWTGRRYGDDPCILGYDLANEPSNQGDASGDVFQAWVEDMSAHVKGLAPRQLVTTGTQGFFGASTPDLLPLNPPSTDPHASTYTGAYLPYTALCEGVDYVRNHAAPGIDFATTHLWPDSAWACSDECKIEGTRTQLRAQLQAAAKFGKPLVVEEFGKVRPVAGRNAFYRMVFDEVMAARAAGLPVGGTLFWMLSAGTYPDYDGSTVFLNGSAYTAQGSIPWLQKRPDEVALLYAQFALWRNFDAMVACLGAQAGNGTEPAWSGGWPDTLALIRGQVAAMGGP